MTLLEQSIDCRQEGDRLVATSHLTPRDLTGENVTGVILYLNPALEILSLEDEPGKLDYTRDRQVTRALSRVSAGERCFLVISHAGGIDDRVCYPGLPGDIAGDAFL